VENVHSPEAWKEELKERTRRIYQKAADGVSEGIIKRIEADRKQSATILLTEELESKPLYIGKMNGEPITLHGLVAKFIALEGENQAAWEAVTQFCGASEVGAISKFVNDRRAELARTRDVK
jgi:hypothetical protein